MEIFFLFLEVAQNTTKKKKTKEKLVEKKSENKKIK